MKKAPRLKSSDIHQQGEYCGPDGRHCLLGWAAVVARAMGIDGMPQYDNPEYCAIRMGLSLAVQSKPGSFLNTAGFNDFSPPHRVAELWNEVLPTLGYELEDR